MPVEGKVRAVKKLAMIGMALWVALPIVLYFEGSTWAGKNSRLRELEEAVLVLLETHNRNVGVINQNFSSLDNRVTLLEDLIFQEGVALRQPLESCDLVHCPEEDSQP